MSSLTEQIRPLRSIVEHISDSRASQPETTRLIPKIGINIARAMKPTIRPSRTIIAGSSMAVKVFLARVRHRLEDFRETTGSLARGNHRADPRRDDRRDVQ